MAEFSYEVTSELGVISENAKGWQTKLNLVSWNGGEPKFDIRPWSPDGERMGKGISLNEEEMDKLVELFKERNSEDSFE
ncbi:MAG: PC4/YdbC family ssDNA-binding protein [Oscillospiraceae bacterium]|nr:PC4/YdbC family ssDNA-binding protein [Oscillospiraceae bacterium]